MMRFYPRKHFHISAFILFFIVIFPFPSNAEGKLKVVASFSIIGDMVREVAGDNVELKTLVKAGEDAHEYEPTPEDIKNMAQADVVFINGLHFEGWMGRLIKSSDYKGKIIAVSDNINAINGDPHAWQDLRNAKIYIINIRNTLAAMDKQNSKKYSANASVYIEKLSELDSWLKEEISKIPKDKRVVISTHDAFGYFARAYGVEFISALGISTHSQASAASLARLIDKVRAKKVSVVFLENMTDSRMMQQLKNDAGARIGGTLYSDSLSTVGGEAPDYLSMIKHNADLLISAMNNTK